MAQIEQRALADGFRRPDSSRAAGWRAASSRLGTVSTYMADDITRNHVNQCRNAPFTWLHFHPSPAPKMRKIRGLTLAKERSSLERDWITSNGHPQIHLPPASFHASPRCFPSPNRIFSMICGAISSRARNFSFGCRVRRGAEACRSAFHTRRLCPLGASRSIAHRALPDRRHRIAQSPAFVHYLFSGAPGPEYWPRKHASSRPGYCLREDCRQPTLKSKAHAPTLFVNVG